MVKYNPTNLELLQKLDQKIHSKEIGFWIENQGCYLWENTFHYSNKIKVGDLSQTKENYYFKMFEEFQKLCQEKQARENFLNSKFQEISDVELIKELENRVKYKPTIKLSMYPNHQHIFIEGGDIRCNSGSCLPIEIKEN